MALKKIKKQEKKGDSADDDGSGENDDEDDDDDDEEEEEETVQDRSETSTVQDRSETSSLIEGAGDASVPVMGLVTGEEHAGGEPTTCEALVVAESQDPLETSGWTDGAGDASLPEMGIVAGEEHTGGELTTCEHDEPDPIGDQLEKDIEKAILASANEPIQTVSKKDIIFQMEIQMATELSVKETHTIASGLAAPSSSSSSQPSTSLTKGMISKQKVMLKYRIEELQKKQREHLLANLAQTLGCYLQFWFQDLQSCEYTWIGSLD